jgi:hypothetical protein
VPLNAELLEAVLEDLEVIDELVVVLGLPVELVEGHLPRVDHVQDLAVDAARAQLLDLRDVQLREWKTGTLSRVLIQEMISVRGTKYPSSIIPKLSFV